jgi:hypothetical protein
MSRVINLADFPQVSREDDIGLTRGFASSSATIEFTLQSATGVTWWKAIELIAPNGDVAQSRSTQDGNHGPTAVMSIPANARGSFRLRLSKAKIFGIHTGMYELDLGNEAGRRLDFQWMRDEDRAGPILGFFRDVGAGVAAAADAVAQAIEDVVGAVADAVADIVETVGNAVADGFEALAGLLGGIPVVGPALYGFFHWISGIITAAAAFVAAAIKAGLNLIADFVAGAIRVIFGGLGGLLAWDATVFVKGLNDFLSGVVGAAITTALTFVGAAQSPLGLQWKKRALTRRERDLLWPIFRNSIAYYNIRVVPGFGGAFSVNNRAVTIGNTIYLKGWDPAMWPDVLVHECTHVWQYQHAGSRYVSEAAGAQAFVPDAYSWQTELTRGNRRWTVFNREAQAQFIQDVWLQGAQTPTGPAGHGAFFTDDPVAPTTVFVDSASAGDQTFLARESAWTVRDPGTYRISTVIDRF